MTPYRKLTIRHCWMIPVLLLGFIIPLKGDLIPQWNSPNIILITLDTVRADHLSLYGYKKSVSPAIDRFAQKCIVFEHAITPIPLTLPSHATIFTGTYPAYHNVRDNSLYQLTSEATTIAEVLKKNKYQTAGFVAAYVLHHRFGLNQGFDIYNDDFSAGRRTELIYAEKDAKGVTDSVINTLSAGYKQPLFLWVHYYDPHDPYTPPPEFSKKTGNDYDGEIAYMDSQIGRLLGYLNSRRLLENSMVIIAGDHGEGLGQHNEKFHGVFLYDSTLHVPLMLCNSSFGTKRIREQVSTLDIYPTILDFLNIKGFQTSQGKSLLPLIKGTKTYQEYPLYLETLMPYFTYGLSPMEGVRTSTFKFIKAPKSELFNVNKDPSELKNVYMTDKETALKMLNRMAKSKSEIPAPLKMKLLSIDKESLEILQSLGYISTPNKTLPAKVNLPDPKDHAGIFEKFTDVQDAMINQKYADAVKILEGLRKELPSCHLANFMLGVAEMSRGNYKIALKLFQQEKPYFKEMALLNSAHVYFRMKEFEKAKTAYSEAIAMNPFLLEAYIAHAEISILQNNFDDAEPMLKKADAIKINDPKLRFLQGLVMAVRQKPYAAENYFMQAIKLNPYYGMAYASLGKLAIEKKDYKSALQHYQKAYSLMPRNRDVILSLAFIKIQPGFSSFPEAYKFYKEALALDPKASDASEIQQVIKDLETAMKTKK